MSLFLGTQSHRARCLVIGALVLPAALIGLAHAEDETRRDAVPRGWNVQIANLDVLVKAQKADGHWDSRKHGAPRASDTICTSLALMALASSGHTVRVGAYRGNVRRAFDWLVAAQQDDGAFYCADDVDDEWARLNAHLLATCAVGEMISMSGQPPYDYAKMDAARKPGELFVGRGGRRKAWAPLIDAFKSGVGRGGASHYSNGFNVAEDRTPEVSTVLLAREPASPRSSPIAARGL